MGCTYTFNNKDYTKEDLINQLSIYNIDLVNEVTNIGLQNASKVVDENGEPRVLYHSTNEDFTEFDTARIGKNYTPHYGAGFYFADSYRGAMEYGGKLGFYFINIKNLKTYSYGFKYESQEKGFQDVADYSKKLGIDGLVYGEEYKQYIVFNPNQIKSATEIKGITLTDTNDIRYLKSVTPTKQISNFTGNYNYLTGEFIADFNIDMLKEKAKNSAKYKNFYSNFEINEKGINLLNDDQITIDKVKQYADENLKQYSIISKQLPNLSENNTATVSKRDEYINNPNNLQKYEGQSFRLPKNKEVILKNSVEDFIRIGQDVFELQDSDGNLSLYTKLEQNKSEYYKVNNEKAETITSLAEYDYLNTTPENFKSVKDFLKGEKPSELRC